MFKALETNTSLTELNISKNLVDTPKAANALQVMENRLPQVLPHYQLNSTSPTPAPTLSPSL